MRYLSLMLMVLALAGISTCGVGPNLKTPAYLPYIEAIDAPDAVRVNERITIQISISMAKAPGILENPAYGIAAGRMSDAEASGGANWYVLSNNDERIVNGPVRSAFVIERRFTSPGTYQIYIGTTASRELGGTAWEIGPDFGFPSEGGIFARREVVIEVLP